MPEYRMLDGTWEYTSENIGYKFDRDKYMIDIEEWTQAWDSFHQKTLQATYQLKSLNGIWVPPKTHYAPAFDSRIPPDYVDLADYGYAYYYPDIHVALEFEAWAEELDRAHWIKTLRAKWGLVEGVPHIERDYGLGDRFNEFAERYGAR